MAQFLSNFESPFWSSLEEKTTEIAEVWNTLNFDSRSEDGTSVAVVLRLVFLFKHTHTCRWVQWLRPGGIRVLWKSLFQNFPSHPINCCCLDSPLFPRKKFSSALRNEKLPEIRINRTKYTSAPKQVVRTLLTHRLVFFPSYFCSILCRSHPLLGDLDVCPNPELTGISSLIFLFLSSVDEV